MKRARGEGSRTAISRACVAAAQKQLFKQLNEGGGCSYLDRVEGELRSRMDIAFTEKMSTSMIVVGPVGSGKKRLVESVLATYRADKGRAGGDKNSHVGIPVARVKGLVCTSDHQALCSIADQFLLRSGIGMEKHINIVLEDLESHFRQCMIDGHPAVVLLEDMHIFAGRDKQVLIYTLLDFMHKQDLLFVVIGLTPCAHLNSLLEKRVLSRLNAQFVYVPPVSGSDVLDELSRRLMLAADAEADVDADGSDAGSVQGFAEYRTQFNARLEAMLGAKQGGSSSSSSSSSSGGGGGVPALAARYTEWGRGISHFLRAAQLAVSLLGSASPFLSAEGFESALHSQEPPGLAERLSGLPMLELLLFCAVARLYGRKLGMGATAAAAAAVVDKGADDSAATTAAGAAAGAGGSDGEGGLGPKPQAAGSASATASARVAGAGRSGGKKAATDVTIEEALREFDALSGGWLRKREIPTARAIGGLQALSLAGLVVLSNSGGKPAQQRLISDKTLVLLVPAEYDVVAAFERRGQRHGQGQGHGPALVVSERVRRAVLEPLAPVT